MSATRTKTFTRTRQADPAARRPETHFTVTQRYHATRLDGVKAKLAEMIEDHETDVVFHQTIVDELRKLKPEDFTSIQDLLTRGFQPAAVKAADESSKVGT